jgi:hypothetical protein
MMVTSIICSASKTPLPASASRSRPRCRCRPTIEIAERSSSSYPIAPVGSRHGASIRFNKKTASSTRRFRGGRPPRWIRNGSKYGPLFVGHQSTNQGRPPQKSNLESIPDSCVIDLSTQPKAKQLWR